MKSTRPERVCADAGLTGPRLSAIMGHGITTARRPMSARVLKGTKQEIAAALARITGEVREAIVFVDEPAPSAPGTPPDDPGDIFAEMGPLMVDVRDVDGSREAI